jgi:hypothetical protein
MLSGAGPAFAYLLFTLPAGQWLEARPQDRAVFGGCSLPPDRLAALGPLAAGPGTRSPSVGTDWVDPACEHSGHLSGSGLQCAIRDRRATGPVGHVAGTHNTLLAITFVFTSLLCRQILARLPLPAGYQVVFVTSFMFGVLCLLSAFLILNRSRRYSSSERTS